MQSSFRVVTLFAFATAAATPVADAQVPGPQTAPPQDARASRGASAGFLLARTGELQLTDAQVVKLAAIARRAEARRQALRGSIDSLRARSPGQAQSDTARREARRRLLQQGRGTMQRLRDQERTDLRDAIAVLTPDQQARAWEMMARGGGRRGFREMRGAGPRGREEMRDRLKRRRGLSES